MDPKALDHLDPKQKEAYERIMGHATNPTNELLATLQPSTDSNPTSDINEPLLNSLSSNPNSTPISDFNSSPLDTPLDATAGNQPQFYTPGQESEPTPSDNAIPSDPNQLSAQLTNEPLEAASFIGPDAPSTPVHENNLEDNLAPPNASFFTNPSPAETEPPAHEGINASETSENEGIPANSADNFAPTTPVVPYTPSETPNFAPATSTFTQPLPSPASVNQEEHHETSPLIRVLYIIGAVVFFAIYTIFWIKVFNLPFLF